MKPFVFAIVLVIASTAGAQTSIPFTFHNSTLQSIPLIIPGVMNPNLSPKSDSGVNLAIGQKVLFKYRGKREVLFVVDESMRGDGTRQRLDVATLIRERKKELDAERG